MKKIAFCLILAGLMLLGVGALAEADMTLLVYLCGADIQDAACYDIREMIGANTGEDVNIVVLAGGSPSWNLKELKGGTRNLLTIRNGKIDTVRDWGWASMGSEESLLEFLKYGLSEFPAEKTVVVLWDHGAGSEGGLCFDETTWDGDGLSLLEINNVFYDLEEALGGFHIDIFGCDACMMATYEMAAMLSYYPIDYFVASEELEPGVGWDYNAWLKEIDRNPSMTTEALCRLIVDSYMASGLRDKPNDYLTLSAVDLRQMDPLQDAMENLGAVLMNELEQGNAADVRRGRSRMYTFGSFDDGSWDMVDMGAMLDAYAQFDPEGADEVRRAMSAAVLVSRQTDNLNPCCGLSVLIPQDTKDEFESYSDGLDLSFYMPNWIGFVKAYAGHLTGGSHSFAQTTPQVVTGANAFAQVAAMFGSTPAGSAPVESAPVGSAPVGSAPEGNEPLGSAPEWAYEASPTQTPAPAQGEHLFSASISAEDLRYLDYVEGMLMMDISDEEMYAYVDLGLIQNNVVNWDSGEIYSLFDGTWPIFGEQLVPLYDQIRNEYGRRSLIPVKLNGEYTYLVVEFKAGQDEGRVLGANAGYDDNGLPIRSTTQLREGDVIVPIYTLYYGYDEDEELEEAEFEGDEILWHEGMTVTYEDLGDGDEPVEMLFCFVLNDVFGEYEMTDVIDFEV